MGTAKSQEQKYKKSQETTRLKGSSNRDNIIGAVWDQQEEKFQGKA